MKTTRTNNSRKRVGVAAAVVVIATTLINCVVVADAHDDASSAIARVCEARDAGTQEAMRTYRLSVSGRRKEMPEGCINNKAQESSCTAPSQFHIVTQTSKEIADYAIIATSINAAYADQHGYGFESVDELTLDQDKFDHRYEKVRMYNQASCATSLMSCAQPWLVTSQAVHLAEAKSCQQPLRWDVQNGSCGSTRMPRWLTFLKGLKILSAKTTTTYTSTLVATPRPTCSRL